MSTAPEEAKLIMMNHSVHEGMRKIASALVSTGLDPLQAVGMMEEQLQKIRKTVETAVERGATP